MRTDLHILSRYLSWALESDAEAEQISPLSGGVHHNLRVIAQVEGKLSNFVVRRMPPIDSLGFARQEVVPYNLEREFTVLTELENTHLDIPKVWGFDRQGEFLGVPAFVMEYINGPTVLEAVKSDPEGVLQSFVNTLLAMNHISPAQVPSVAKAQHNPAAMMDWLVGQNTKIQLPANFQRGLKMLNDLPINAPQSTFGNGDLNPQNFIYKESGRITVIDWEYAGFNNALAELMLLHVWPEDDPFLNKYPLDKMYCHQAGIDINLLKWHELYSALSGWVYAAKDQRHKMMSLHEQWVDRLVS